MKRITFYLDFISPYAYLAFEKLPEALEGLSYSVDYVPVLFMAMLKAHGQLGPAEIAPKREWTYRQVLWHAHTNGVPMQMPATHPFNPLPLLRLSLACARPGELPNRHVCEEIFHHVWRGGADAGDAARLAALTQLLAPVRGVGDEGVKAELKGHTDRAIAGQVFGVPTFEVEGQRFWGFDALPMVGAYLQGDAWFAGPQWRDAAALPGLQRRSS